MMSTMKFAAKSTLWFLLMLMTLPQAQAVRLKDIANIRGVRDNQLIGYGLVVGLKASGDSKADFTNKSMARMLEKLGIKSEGDVTSKNVAAVLVTATLPPFARAGNKMDITVNAIGDATNLDGGTLVQTPLKASDQNVYAVAQGTISVAKVNGKATQGTVGFAAGAGIIEKDIVAENFSDRKMYRLTLHNPDITTAVRVAQTVNMDLGGKYASTLDPATIDVVVPFAYEGKGLELLATIESLNVEPDMKAKVVINEKTGTVVIGENVRISTVAISHGDINLKVGTRPAAAPPAPVPPTMPDSAPAILSNEGAPVPVRGPASVASAAPTGKESVKLLQESMSVGELVQSLNQMGVSPKDLIVILQNIKASGALQGELEIL
jgi:flagellar P-ring protein precursor FlgI